ncbi:hypothetical protein JK359_17335 [Streptomyces actinomycinicus]|uniref:Uncharacterized protein n=1 Tax=Streptomyces actinomycinicus TaxID=1695166 RepID=A0A937JMP0_9ACTN|nr:hypothetical protein [Streptomyces actinomycinicus]MBL1083710.1 hypothetical protein [Streptomyces actinomycinicus]
MLEAALTALAAAGGTAVVQAAGTDAWDGVKARVARLLGRGDQNREQAELERLDQAASTLQAAGADEGELVRARQESSWQTRFEALLENLAGEERGRAAAQLRALVEERTGAVTEVSAGDGGVAVGGNVNIRAEHAGVAAWTMGDVSVNPPSPSPRRG